MTAQSLYRRIIRLRGVKIKFVYLKDDKHELFGTYGEGVIRINLNKNNAPLKNAIHEWIHHLYPSLAHEKVYHWESVLWNYLSVKKKLKLYKKMFNI